MESTHLASLGFALASAVLFGLVARTVHRRPVSPQAKGARNAFVFWWGCLSFLSVAGAILVLPFVPSDVPLFLEATIAILFLLCVGLAGLLYYLVFIYTSRRGAWKPIAAGYLLLFGMLMFLVLRTGPFHVEETGWGRQLKGATELEGTPLSWAVVILFIVPPLVAAGAYLSLYRKVDDAGQKRRILLVGLSIFLWFGTSLGASVGNVQLATWWQVASRVISLAAAAMVYYAFAGIKQPPATPQGQAPPSPYLAGDPLDPRRRLAAGNHPAS
jgi:hypothetical protein